MKVIFIPDNPYITKAVQPTELIKARTTERDYIESVLLTHHDDPSKFELRPETNFPGVSYIRRTHTTFTGHVDVSYDRAYVPIIIDSHIHSATWDIQNFIKFVAWKNQYYQAQKFKPDYKKCPMNYWFIRYHHRDDIPQALLDWFREQDVTYEIPEYYHFSCGRMVSDELLQELYPNGDMDVTLIEGTLVDNYFCEGPFDLSKITSLDSDKTYLYAVFLEEYENSWSSLHTVVFTTDELWYHQLLHQYQSECLNDE